MRLHISGDGPDTATTADAFHFSIRSPGKPLIENYAREMRVMYKFMLLLGGLLAVGSASDAQEAVNSLGMRMIAIQPGKFTMGAEGVLLPESLGGPTPDRRGDADERPAHTVAINYPFFIAETEVTVAQYRQFRPDHQDAGRYSPYVSGISWEDASEFCQWLSHKEGKEYRLPSEAEWEYACRAGTSSFYSSGDLPPGASDANAWGLKNMHSGPAEWCLDWHGPYPEWDQSDPRGPATGVARVIRGGGVQDQSLYSEVGGEQPYYRRSANRAGAPPSYRGGHITGFRVVQAPLPKTPFLEVEEGFARQCIKQTGVPVEQGPDAGKPHFKVRPLLPIPIDNIDPVSIEAAGFEQPLQGHNHSPGIVACPNGDLLALMFSATASHFAEYWPNEGVIAARLRYGADEWDFPTPFFDIPDVNDGPIALMNDSGLVQAYIGGIGMVNTPFKRLLSGDSGATWSAPELPMLTGPIGGYTPQPISPPFRGPEGGIYLPMDGLGAQSLLWKSLDEGKTWMDTGGRSGGRHTTYAMLSDGRILGMGGKNSNIDGFMPKSITSDNGRSYVVSKTPFAALSTNQRPSLLRLQSGRLFFAGDFRNYEGKRPESIKESGSYAALSEDDGETWIIRKLPGALPHESKVIKMPEKASLNKHGDDTLGYSAACQSPNGIIQLITTMNHPCLHFELNEAWIMGASESSAAAEQPVEATVRTVTGEEKYEDSRIKASWRGQITSNGTFRLDGPETWLYPDGSKEWAAVWKNGKRIGEESFWRKDGSLAWTWSHPENGPHVWKRYWRNGKSRSESFWVDGKCNGMATLWSPEGEILSQTAFKDGLPAAAN